MKLKSSPMLCRNWLDKLGEPRAPVAEQRLYLLYISQSFQSLVKAAVDGTYNDPFFENAKTELGYQKRIRAVMQNLNYQSCIDSWVKYTTLYLSLVVVSETECCNNANLINTTSLRQRLNCRLT
jgi:hypothetical protein